MSAQSENGGSSHQGLPGGAQVWTGVSNWTASPSLNPQSWAPNGEVTTWFTDLFGPSGSGSARCKGIRSLVILVIWTLWCERKARFF
jgi:hypothetical protein